MLGQKSQCIFLGEDVRKGATAPLASQLHLATWYSHSQDASSVYSFFLSFLSMQLTEFHVQRNVLENEMSNVIWCLLSKKRQHGIGFFHVNSKQHSITI